MELCKEYLGLGRNKAIKLAETSGLTWRIVAADGHSRARANNMKKDRINFELECDVVVKAYRG